MSRKNSIVPIIAALLLSSTRAVEAFVLRSPGGAASPDSGLVFFHWDCRQFTDCTIPYGIGQGTNDMPGTSENTQIDNAFGVWRNVTPAVIGFANAGPPAASAIAADNENVLFWDNNHCDGNPWDASKSSSKIGMG